jgi:hypothetical protein
MVHVFRIGPFRVGKRDAFAYAAVDERGAMLQPEVAHRDEEGLSAIARRHSGVALRCEPALASAARPFGFEPAELPPAALVPRAILAFGLGLGLGGAGRPDLEVLTRFFEACAAYWRARPWQLIDSDEAIRVELVQGSRRRLAEASVLGAGGEEFGLAVYDEPGSIRRVAEAMDRGEPHAAARVLATAVTFDDEPAWAARTFEDAFDLPRFPVPLRIRKGKPAPAGSDDLPLLTAVLEALVELAGSGELAPGEATVNAGGAVVSARVSLPDGLELDASELAEPMLVAEPMASSGRAARTPRNAPCPCGSGRKYKKCHLANDEENESRARGTGPGAEEARADARRLAERDPVHGLSERITADALALARKRWGREFDPEAVLVAARIDQATAQALLGWCSDHHRGPDGRTALDLYLAERGGALDETGRRLVEALGGAWFSFHEVVAAEPGVSLTLRDLLAGGERTVQERTASRTARARDVLLTRLVDLGDRAILAGCHLRSLPPREADLARRLVRKVLRTRAKHLKPAQLRELTADGTILALWQQVVESMDSRPLPKLQNTDGEDFLVTVDRFEVAPGKSSEVIAGLLELPDARRDDDDEGRVEISFVREGNAKGVLPTTLVGRATLEGGGVRLETNSVARADRLRRLVEERLGGLVRFRIREHADPTPRLGGAAGTARPQEPLPTEALEALKAFQSEHYRKWLDEAIPALGGLTPRAAAARKGAPREALMLLLADFEHAEAGRPPEMRFDVTALRRELGVE